MKLLRLDPLQSSGRCLIGSEFGGSGTRSTEGVSAGGLSTALCKLLEGCFEALLHCFSGGGTDSFAFFLGRSGQFHWGGLGTKQ